MKRLAALLVLSAAAWANDGPRVFYSKSFPGSVPAYVSIDLAANGTAVYKESPNDEEPVHFKIGEADVKSIFAIVEKLDRFKSPLESNLKVANMGEKTFRFENGSEKREVKFNYSLDENAKLLLDWFERLSETQQMLFMLERSVRYDRLGVNKSLLQLETAYDRNRLVGVDRFLPLLDRVIKNEVYMHMARERASYLADAFRNPKPAPAERAGQ